MSQLLGRSAEIAVRGHGSSRRKTDRTQTNAPMQATGQATAARPSSGVNESVTAILTSLETIASGTANRESCNRRHERLAYRIKCSLRFSTGGTGLVDTLTAWTRNISRGGIGLVARRLLRRGDPVYVSLPRRDAATLELPGQVAFARCVRTGWYEVGVQFVPPRANDPLAPDADPAAAAPAPAASTETKSASETLRKVKALADLREAAPDSEVARNKIIRMVSSKDVVVRTRAVEALVSVGASDAREHLVRALADDTADVRAAALDAIEALALEEAAADIKPLLESQSELERLRAARTLGCLGDTDGLSVVKQFLDGEGKLTRMAAAAYGVIVKTPFAANDVGVAKARDHMQAQQEDTPESE